ncbi:MAG TPA: N-acetylmuramoyl-L-alanine amidase, partial [Burkholderiaceae bacterium]|nr:N-acetylmuramoyl-L-alanine amidase [Burkholderiaceae bacterium]
IEIVGGCKLVDLTAQSARDVEKGNRDPKSVYALVLHQMACCFERRDPMRSYLRIKSHYAILADGTILYLHPPSRLIWASHGFNARSVAVEFAGNFPDTKGKWWQGEKYGRNQLTPAQIKSGRCLIQHLVRTMGLREVLAHRQSSNMRTNDPGPDVWSQVGQWAVDKLGLSDGGPGFKIGTGSPIPDEWRTWRRGSAPELGFEGEADELESDEPSWRGAPEGVTNAELTLARAIDDSRARGPGIYTLYKNGRRLYVGRATNLRQRLMQHRWCLEQVCDAGRQRSTAVGSGPSYTVKLTPMRGADAAQLKRVESATIARWKRRSEGGPLTN